MVYLQHLPHSFLFLRFLVLPYSCRLPFNSLPVCNPPALVAPDGTPVSSAYGDVYHSAHGGPAQARHVFLGGNKYRRAGRGGSSSPSSRRALAWGSIFSPPGRHGRPIPARCARLDFVSVEKHPFHAADLARAHAGWFFAAWPGLCRCPFIAVAVLTMPVPLELVGGTLRLTLLFGDACRVLPLLDLAADAFYLDGFSPARNPRLWSSEICVALARCAQHRQPALPPPCTSFGYVL